MNYTPYHYRQLEWPFKLIYNEYQRKLHSKGDECAKLISYKDNKVIVQGMWRMQLIGELHSGLWSPSYDDCTNWEYYDEVIWLKDSAEDREAFRQENLHQDTYADYFDELAKVAADIGCERAEIKCLIKALILRYRPILLNSIDDFPHYEFCKLYNRLTRSKDPDQIRVAERLGRHYHFHLKWFMKHDIGSKLFRARCKEEEDYPTMD